MAVTPLGRDRLSELFERSCRIVLANEAATDSGAAILGAVFVLHHDDESTQVLSFYGLDLGSGAIGTFDNDRPSSSPVVLVEALLRMRADERAGVVDAYAAASDGAEGLRSVTFGIKGSDEVLAPEDHLIAEAPRFAVFGRPAR